MRFSLHDLHESEFEQLVTLICREVLGIGITSFAKGKDGGKDAKFEGTANAFPSTAAPATGKFIVQAKHTSSPTGSCSDSGFVTLIKGELPKIQRQFNEGRLTHYLVFTNRRKPGGADDAVTDLIKSSTSVQNVWLRGYEDIERELSLHPHWVKALGLDKLRSPLQFVPEDMRDVILALHAQRSVLPTAFDSEHDFQNYPGLPKKNSINRLSAAYDSYIRQDSMMHFATIRRFLENPRNADLADQYHAVADDLRGQLIAHRDRFDSFDLALEHVFVLMHERSPELVPRRKLLKTVLHYMYVDCDIGEKE